MATLRDEILAFKQRPNEPLHEIWERYRTMVKECPNNDMMEAMIQQTLYMGINTTNQCMVNQLGGGNFMTTPYMEACEILDEMSDTSLAWQSRANFLQGDPNMIHLHKELHDYGKAIAELTTTMNQLAMTQLQQVQGPKQVNAIEGVSMIVKKRRKKDPQFNWDTVVNPKGGNNTGHVMTVSTRSGKVGNAITSSQRKLMDDENVVQEDKIPNNEVQSNEEVRIDIDDNVEETQEEVNPSREHIVDIPEQLVTKAKAPMPRPHPSYRQRLTKKNGENQFNKFFDMMKSLSINVPLVEALEQMPNYAKFMKDLVTMTRSMNCETIDMTHKVNVIVHSMDPRLEDPGAFTIPCTIGSAQFAKALFDLGTSINLMPYSIFKTLGIGQPKPTSMDYKWRIVP
ncbi:uncharacterized protein [Nicotiana sylvestris]|uniref:uncharacterized protein n=1 Tax=Nicotiana sylvestris TaxID=4096 RepID=UPI00388C8492